MKVEKLEKSVEITEGTEVKVDGLTITVKGKKGEVVRAIRNPKIFAEIKDNQVFLSATKATKKEKKEIFTYISHIKNMIKGSNEGHVYELKICSGHFPMNVSIQGKELVVKNFIGEKFPRRLKIQEGVIVKIEGEKITVEHTSKEIAGQSAANIEQLTRRPNFDSRIFQDGIYITVKDGKQI